MKKWILPSQSAHWLLMRIPTFLQQLNAQQIFFYIPMNPSRSFFPTVDSGLRRELPSLSSFSLLNAKSQSAHKFTLKNLQRLHEDYPEQLPQTNEAQLEGSRGRQPRHRQLNSYATLDSFGRSADLLAQAKIINNKYFQVPQRSDVRLSSQKENAAVAVVGGHPQAMKRYRSFRNKWFEQLAQ